jgi:4-diphosphocytidyl-2-C-methyl-D-erythritol kinase
MYAPAKINLFFNILSKQKDSYHTINTVMQSVDIYDILTIEKTANDKIQLKGDLENICKVKDNTAHKAAKAFLKHAKLNFGLTIFCQKKIPVESGLGGESADASAVLLALNKMFFNKFETEKLCKIAKNIGADIPFFINGGCVFAKGIGEKINPIKTKLRFFLVIVKPSFGVSTKKAYKIFDEKKIIFAENCGDFIKKVEKNNLKEVSESLFNCFEGTLNIKEIFDIKNKFKNYKALGSSMSGSGSAVFGIFEDRKTAEFCFLKFRKEYEHVFICKTINFGCRIFKK